jgi:hypothetical protein
MPDPILVALDPRLEDDTPLTVGAGLARVTRAPVMAIAACVDRGIANAITPGRRPASLPRRRPPPTWKRERIAT